MYKVAVLTGARPQIIKAAALHRAMMAVYSDALKPVYIHTGQHYDRNLSEAAFLGLDLPKPEFDLGVGSASHAIQTAEMLERTEKALKIVNPGCLILYGDTNTTLAGAIAGTKLGIPIVHIEAGCRSFNMQMPEEINRIVCDRISTLLFCPSEMALANLRREGFTERKLEDVDRDHPGIYNSGDIMLDNFIHYGKIAEEMSDVLGRFRLEKDGFWLCTVHREANTSDPDTISSIFEGAMEAAHAAGKKLVVPLHPRTMQFLKAGDLASLLNKIKNDKLTILIPPVSYLDMLMLEKNAGLVLTDSGGLQKEAYFAGRPCVILREETEWTEITDSGAGILAGGNKQRILEACRHFTENRMVATGDEFGNGKAAAYITGALIDWLGSSFRA